MFLILESTRLYVELEREFKQRENSFQWTYKLYAYVI